jgi:hypothetical protein
MPFLDPLGGMIRNGESGVREDGAGVDERKCPARGEGGEMQT